MKKINKIIINIMLIFVIFLQSAGALAASIPHNELAPVLNSSSKQVYISTPDIPQDAIDFAKNTIENEFGSILQFKDVIKYDLDNISFMSLGTPFYGIILEEGSISKTDVIYIPIIADDSIILMLKLVNIEGEWNSCISTELVDKLKLLPNNTSDDPYSIYFTKQACYAKNNTGTYILQGYDNFQKYDGLLKSTKNRKQAEIFTDTNVENILLPMLDLSEKFTSFSDRKSEINTIKMSNLAATPYIDQSLDMSYCLLLQYDKEICWAACLGTAFRYTTGNRTVTAMSICDMLNMPYEGIVPSAVASKYNQLQVGGTRDHYSYINKFATQFQVMNDINNKFPFHMHVDILDGGAHALLAEGYIYEGDLMKVKYWNPWGYHGNTYQYRDTNGKVYVDLQGRLSEWYATTLVL